MNPEASEAHSATESCLRAVQFGLDRSDTFPFQRPLDHGHRRLDRRVPPGGFSSLNWGSGKELAECDHRGGDRHGLANGRPALMLPDGHPIQDALGLD